MHSWKRSCTGCTPRPGTEPGARYSMHWTGQNSGHLPHGKQRLTSMKATSRGRFFFSPNSSGMSGMRSSFRRRRMTSIAAMRSRVHPLASVDDHRSRDLALLHRLEGTVHVVELDAARDELVDLQPAAHVELDELRHVAAHVCRAVQRSDDRLLL